jgi:hypothetical protein
VIKLPITSCDIDGVEFTKEYYFNISIPEATELTLSMDGGFVTYMQQIVDKKSGAELIQAMANFVKLSYGVRNEDNQFEKSERATAIFLASDAYSELFMRLVTEADFAANFITGLFPKDLQERVARMQIVNELEGQFSAEPAKERDIESYTTQELADMPLAEFKDLGKKHRHNLPNSYLIVAFDRAGQ